MPKLIIEMDDGTKEEYTNFFAAVARDSGDGVKIREAIWVDCRILIAGTMLRKAIIKANAAWNEFVKRAFPYPPLALPDDEALQNRIKYSSN